MEHDNKRDVHAAKVEARKAEHERHAAERAERRERHSGEGEDGGGVLGCLPLFITTTPDT
jgi:hypothetical protein